MNNIIISPHSNSSKKSANLYMALLAVIAILALNTATNFYEGFLLTSIVLLGGFLGGIRSEVEIDILTRTIITRYYVFKKAFTIHKKTTGYNSPAQLQLHPAQYAGNVKGGGTFGVYRTTIMDKDRRIIPLCNYHNYADQKHDANIIASTGHFKIVEMSV